MKTDLKDGLYQVTTNIFCAGFIVKDGVIIDMAPILRKKILYWKSFAKFICE